MDGYGDCKTRSANDVKKRFFCVLHPVKKNTRRSKKRKTPPTKCTHQISKRKVENATKATAHCGLSFGEFLASEKDTFPDESPVSLWKQTRAEEEEGTYEMAPEPFESPGPNVVFDTYQWPAAPSGLDGVKELFPELAWLEDSTHQAPAYWLD